MEHWKKERITGSSETLLFRTHGGDEVIMESASDRVVTAGSCEGWGTSRGGSGWSCAWLEVKKVEWEGRVLHLVCILGERDCVRVWACQMERCATLQRKLCGFKVLWVTAVLPLSSFSPSPQVPMGRAFQSTVSASCCHAQTCHLQLPILSNFTPALEDPTSPPQFAVCLSLQVGCHAFHLQHYYS